MNQFLTLPYRSIWYTAERLARIRLAGRFVAFKSRQSLAAVKKWIPGDNFERARGIPEECSLYCKKGGDFTEEGVIPTTTGRPSKFGDALKLAENGETDVIKSTHPGLFLRYNPLRPDVFCKYSLNADYNSKMVDISHPRGKIAL